MISVHLDYHLQCAPTQVVMHKVPEDDLNKSSTEFWQDKDHFSIRISSQPTSILVTPCPVVIAHWSFESMSSNTCVPTSESMPLNQLQNRYSPLLRLLGPNDIIVEAATRGMTLSTYTNQKYGKREALGHTACSTTDRLDGFRDLRFSLRCCWRFKSSGILHRVDRQIVTDISKNRSTFKT